MNHLELLLAQKAPTIDSMYWIMLVSRILHILGAIILVGGLFYIRSVVSPMDVPPGTTPVDQLFGGRRATWAKWIGIATTFLLVTGLWNYIQIIKQHERLPPSYHAMAGIKMLVAIAVFFLAALLAGRTSAADKLRENWRRWLNVCLILGLITVILGSVLRSYPHTPKVNAPGPPELMAPLNATAQ